MQDNLRVCRIAWSKIAGNRIDWKKVLSASVAPRRLICETSCSSAVLVRMLASFIPLALLLCLDIDLFFRRCSSTVCQIYEQGGVALKCETSLGTKTKLRRPSRHAFPLGPRLKKIEITFVANGSPPLDPPRSHEASSLSLLANSYDPRPSSIVRPFFTKTWREPLKRSCERTKGLSYAIEERGWPSRTGLTSWISAHSLLYDALSFIIPVSLDCWSNYKSNQNTRKKSQWELSVDVCTQTICVHINQNQNYFN